MGLASGVVDNQAPEYENQQKRSNENESSMNQCAMRAKRVKTQSAETDIWTNRWNKGNFPTTR